MNRDPFDQLRDRNPVPERELPSAPMAQAERIMETDRRTRGFHRPGWAYGIAAAVVALVAGGAWMLWIGSDDQAPVAASSTDGTEADAQLSAASGTTAMQARTVVAYFLVDQEPRQSLIPASRTAMGTSDAEAAVASLLHGPTREEGEGEPRLITAMPPDATVVVGAVEGGVAAVDLSPWFTSGADGAADALAQLVFTLTRVADVTGVAFTVEGEPHVVVAGTLALVPRTERDSHPHVDDPATRQTFEAALSPAMIEDPPYGDVLVLPGTVTGVANSVGNRVGFAVTDAGGNVLWSTDAPAACGTTWSECRGDGDWSTWAVEVPVIVDTAQAGYLVASAYGSGVAVIGERRQPVILQPSAGVTTVPSTPEPPTATEVAVYLFVEDDGTQVAPGPYLVPAMRTTAVLSAPTTDIVRATVEFLLAGPTPGESGASPAVSSAIPEGTELLGLEVDGGIAAIDLSVEFVSGGGSLSMSGRLAQVVFTLTQFDEIDGVRFLIDGVPTTVFGGEGVLVDDPATGSEFEGLLPAVFIQYPPYGGVASSPAVVRGTANVFEGTVSLALADAEGLVLWEGFATASCGTGCRGGFEIHIPYEIETAQMGSITAWEASAQDGRPTNVRRHPVWLAPTDGSAVTTATACSGAEATSEAARDPSLPAEVASTRSRLWEAAALCDWDTLAGAVDGDLSYSFGESGDPIGYWIGLEVAGARPMLALAEMLAAPHATMDAGDGRMIYVWPSAASYPSWDAVPEAAREALRPLYGDDAFEDFAAFGAYAGYRVGIADTGEWLFFVAGD